MSQEFYTQMVEPHNGLQAIVLAAGLGTRMRSPKPKVLHEVLGKPMLAWVLQSLQNMQAFADAQGPSVILVTSEEVYAARQSLGNFEKNISAYVLQEERRGTGDAVASASLAFKGVTIPAYRKARLIAGEAMAADECLILTGDAPAVRSDILDAFIQTARAKDWQLAVLGIRLPNPSGYGRLVTDEHGDLIKIVEEKDADPATKTINLVNSGVIYARVPALYKLVATLQPNNKSNEYYLTDVISLARAAGFKAGTYETDDADSFQGVNDPEQLAQMESYFLRRKS